MICSDIELWEQLLIGNRNLLKHIKGLIFTFDSERSMKPVIIDFKGVFTAVHLLILIKFSPSKNESISRSINVFASSYQQQNPTIALYRMSFHEDSTFNLSVLIV